MSYSSPLNVERQAVAFAELWRMGKGTVIVRDIGVFHGLWVAGGLDLLLKLNMKIVVIDGIYDGLTSDYSELIGDEIRNFIDGNPAKFIFEATEIGSRERVNRLEGRPRKSNAAELAVADFMSADSGFKRFVETNEPLTILFEDAGITLVNKPSNLYLLSTAGLLHGLQITGVIFSANEVIQKMQDRKKSGSIPSDARKASAYGELETTEGSATYHSSFVLWTREQAEELRLLEPGAGTKLDVLNVAEEIEALGREAVALVSIALVDLLVGLIKLAVEPSDAEVDDVIDAQSRAVFAADNGVVDHVEFQAVWKLACRNSTLQLSSIRQNLPSECPLSLADLVDVDFQLNASVEKMAAAMQHDR